MPWRQAIDQFIRAVAGGDDVARVEVEDDGLGALRAAVDAEEIHGWRKVGFGERFTVGSEGWSSGQALKVVRESAKQDTDGISIF